MEQGLRFGRFSPSWRDALSRSLEVINEGEKAHPYRAPNKWAVNFQQNPSLEINFEVSVGVVVTRGNSTSEPELSNVIGN